MLKQHVIKEFIDHYLMYYVDRINVLIRLSCKHAWFLKKEMKIH